ncbi:TPA: transcription termination factor NusG [Salmonella enterica]|mgnify:FL=1|uniref:Transcription termination factor NusG n=1 Tax=Salmonella enterica TaxID=28901 RepID=A0A5V0L8A2_SALER|nr:MULTISPECIES: transcription termination factor NusG [Enterobacteriaceae]EAM7689108.1 transcription termination factor NusG [Salmonella enterica]EBD3364991.1 transcription termination factor NusG [Salmonella enterica subsp. enterica serovar Bareilly]EBP3741949.1 transcription termination factor NusG [Salmonella enterica subsp. enterica]EBZ0661062.1 transcription termination factor NusG [Salmonella enterica subsp. enterica serovar Haifa]ECG5407368.1 transcription termination factor NusG [Salm
MNIEQLAQYQWFLARYITGGRNRELLFSWLSEQHIVPWTPLKISHFRRSDKRDCYRKRITPVFPGYFFLKANFEVHSIASIRCHSAFCDFVHFGGTIRPVRPMVVEALMSTWVDPTLNRAAQAELEAASHLRLTQKQYNYLLDLDMRTEPVSRITMLYNLAFNTADTLFSDLPSPEELEPCSSRFL